MSVPRNVLENFLLTTFLTFVLTNFQHNCDIFNKCIFYFTSVRFDSIFDFERLNNVYCYHCFEIYAVNKVD